MLSLASLSTAFAPPSVAHVAPASAQRATSVRMETEADLEALAKELNPSIGYYNPTPLATMEFWGQSNEATIGFLRQAEIKHGRVAMAAFVGFVVQSNGIHFPWNLSNEGVSFGDISAAGGPAAQWDALPTISKMQIILFVGCLEWWSENDYALKVAGEKHYMRGGKPGAFPSFKGLRDAGLGQPPLDLFDPFGFSKKASPEKKSKGLLAEINNGRLAMLGIMAFVSEAKVPGAVPALKGLITPYAGETMAPFGASDNLPFVAGMLSSAPF